MVKTKKKPTADFLKINELELDREWIHQPSLFFKYAVGMADARREMDKAKAHLDVIRAVVDRSVRADPEKFSLPKITETTVSGAVELDEGYREAHSALIESRHEHEIMKAAVDALENRKAALEKLVTLHGQNYFSKPEPPAGMKEEMEEVEKQHVRSRSARRQ